VPRTSRLLPGTIQVPRERIEAALTQALNEDVPTNLRAIATSVGLGTARRLYKGFHDLRSAVVAKNGALRRQRGAAIEKALTAAFHEQPVPTVAEVARRLGFAGARPVATRFPELSATLTSHQRNSVRRSVVDSSLLKTTSDPAVQP
jgi:hypothetical protein